MKTKNLTPQEVKTLAITTENRIVQVALSEDEKLKTMDDFFQKTITILNLQEEFSRVKENFKLKLKELAQSRDKFMQELRLGYIETEEKCFLIDNQDAGLMEYYTEEGKLVYSRPLRPDERQLNVFSQNIKKIGN